MQTIRIKKGIILKMKNYEKPIVLINEELSEGVYAASGAGRPGCDSQYMSGVWQPYTGGWDKTVKKFYGCIGCPAYRNGEIKGCALLVDQAYLDGATSYDIDAGNRMPEWERREYSAGHMVNDVNGLPY